MGEVSESECGSAEVFEAAVDGFGRTVAGVGVVEVGQDVPGSVFKRSGQRDELGQAPGYASVRGTPAPVVEFLLDASAALIESITGQVHDMEGIHDRPRSGEFFSGGALKSGESIHRDDLNILAPGVGREASQVLKTRLERPGTMSKSREGPLRSWTGVKSKMTVT